MNTNDVLQAAGKTAPPIAYYVGVRLLGLSLPDWVAVMTLGYIVLQSVYLIWRWRRQARRHTAD